MGGLTSTAGARRIRKEDKEARVERTVCVAEVSRKKANPQCQNRNESWTKLEGVTGGRARDMTASHNVGAETETNIDLHHVVFSRTVAPNDHLSSDPPEYPLTLLHIIQHNMQTMHCDSLKVCG